MKKIYRHILLAAAILLTLPTMAQTGSGNNPDDVTSTGLKVNKTVTETPDADGKYYIEIEAYATGKETTTIVHAEKPVDVVLALDFSSSMVTTEFTTPIALDRAYTYDDCIISAVGTNKNYFYKLDDEYCQVNRTRVAIGGKETPYYYLYWQDGPNKKYFDRNEVNKPEAPKTYTTTDQPIYYTEGNICTYDGSKYVKSSKASLTYDDVNGDVTYYYNNGGDPETAGQKTTYYYLTVKDGAENKYLKTSGEVAAYTDVVSSSATIYSGVLYLKEQKNVWTAKIGNSTYEFYAADEEKTINETLYTKENNVVKEVQKNKFKWNELGNYYYCTAKKPNLNKPGDFVKVTTSGPVSRDVYNAQTSANYSYETITNAAEVGTTYYWKKAKNNYLPVSAGSDEYVFPEPNCHEIFAGYGTTTTGGISGYGLSFTTKSGVTYYLTNDESGKGTITTTATGVATSTETIYTGELYGKTRLTSLQAAMSEFLDSIYQKTVAGGQHLISLLAFETDVDTYAYDGETHIKLDSQEKLAAMKNYIYHYEPVRGTDHPEAIQTSYNLLKDCDHKDRKSVVVMFTDGETWSGTGNYDAQTKHNYALTAFSQTPGSVSDLKAIADVYCIALVSFPKEKNEYSWIWPMLKAYSSMYPDAKSDADLGTEATDGSKYFKEANVDGTDLSDMFVQIADDINTEGGSDIELTEKSLVAVDVMTSYFKLPDGVDASDIELFVQQCTSVANDGTLGFADTRIALPDHTNHPEFDGVQVACYNKEVNVYGFDYGTYFCGSHAIEGSAETEPGGYKLIFKIPVVVDPMNPGGANLQTNEPWSGIYTAQTDDDGNILLDDNGLPLKDDKMSSFQKPQVNLPNIIIRKSGLMNVGESATFLIQKVDESNKVIEGFNSFSVVVSVKSTNDIGKTLTAKVKLQEEGRYKVTETSWAWGYLPEALNSWATEKSAGQNSISHSPGDDDMTCYVIRNVNKSTEQADAENERNVGTVFPFNNSPVEGIEKGKYSESFKHNIFYTPEKYVITSSEQGGGTGFGGEEEISDEPGEPGE